MQFVVGILVVLWLINALGWVFWAVVGALAALFAIGQYAQWKEEQDLSPEQREERAQQREEQRARRRQMREEREHHREMLKIEQEHLEAQRRAQSQNALLGTAGKIAASMAISYLTGGNHRHKH